MIMILPIILMYRFNANCTWFDPVPRGRIAKMRLNDAFMPFER